MGNGIEKLTNAYTAANAQVNKDQKLANEAAKRILKRQKGIVGLVSVAKESYKKDGSYRNAAKAVANTVIDGAADNVKDLKTIFTHMPTFGVGTYRTISVFSRELAK